MTQDERWLMQYNEVKGFIETNKLYNSSELMEGRVEKFEKQLDLYEKKHHVNQYT